MKIKDLPIEIQKVAILRTMDHYRLNNGKTNLKEILTLGVGQGFSWIETPESSKLGDKGCIWSNIDKGDFKDFYKLYPTINDIPEEAKKIILPGEKSYTSYKFKIVDFGKKLMENKITEYKGTMNGKKVTITIKYE